MTALYRVRTVFTGVQGSPWLSTMYFLGSGGTEQQAATAVGVFWGAVDARMASNVAWATEAEVVTIDSTDGQPTAVTATTPSSGAGASGSTLLPIVTQGLLRWRTGFFIAGRELRGRTFIPGLTENDNDVGIPNGSITGTVDPIAATLIGSANAELVIFSRTHFDFAVVSSGTMWTSWAELKSRRD